MSELFKAWLKTRPESIQRLAAEFPLGTTFGIGDKKAFLVGYNEGDMLILSYTDPYNDYEKATTEQFYLCASHARNGVPA